MILAVVVFVVSIAITVTAEGFSWHRPNRARHQQSIQRPLSTHFRHRIGAQQVRTRTIQFNYGFVNGLLFLKLKGTQCPQQRNRK